MEDEVILHLPEDVHKLCRTCMAVTDNLLCHDILLYNQNQSTLAGEMFEFCFSIQIIPDDGLPRSICDDCANKIEIAYNFKHQCEETETNLRKILNLSSSTTNNDKNLEQNKSTPFIKTENCSTPENTEVTTNSGLVLYDTSSFENFIDNSDNNKFNLFFPEKKGFTDDISLNNDSKVSVLQTVNNNSSLQIDILQLIEERKSQHFENETNEYNDILSLIEERKQSNMIKREINSDEEINNYNCKICSSSFQDQDSLDLHLQNCNSTSRNDHKIVLGKILKLEDVEVENVEFIEENVRDNSPPYECSICGCTFKTKYARNGHMSQHHSISDQNTASVEHFTCDLCSKVFSTETKLAIHFYKHAECFYIEFNDNELSIKAENVCNLCHEIFNDQNELIVHTEKHITSDEVKCEICNLDFIGELNLVKHLKQHHGLSVLLCRICLKRFDSVAKLKEHLKLHEIENLKIIVKCPICKTQFSSIRDLKTHSIDHIHESFECSHCKRTFNNKVLFEVHEKQHIEPRFLCSLCGKQYFSSVTLACHIRTHTNEKPFTCPHCKKGFSSRATLSVHKRIHSGFKPYICSYCGYSCRQSGDLVMHIRTHTGDKPYKCNFPNCDRKFTTSSQRREHYRRHTNERNHKCTVCNKAFLESKTLKVHMLTHTGEKPHACEVCGKKFRRTHHLSNHMKAHRDHVKI